VELEQQTPGMLVTQHDFTL